MVPAAGSGDPRPTIAPEDSLGTKCQHPDHNQHRGVHHVRRVLLLVAQFTGKKLYETPGKWHFWTTVTQDDPSGFANSLEWVTSCPPPRHNFPRIPRIRSKRRRLHPRTTRTSSRIHACRLA